MKVRTFAFLAACCCTAAPLTAQSLTQTDILALQQQLRDDGCGVAHVTGRIDAITRRALKQCASKYNATDTSPAAVLAAMNIGFTAGASSSAMGGTLGNDASDNSSMTPGKKHARRGRRPTTTSNTPNTPSTPSTPSTPVPSTPTPEPTPMPTTPSTPTPEPPSNPMPEPTTPAPSTPVEPTPPSVPSNPTPSTPTPNEPAPPNSPNH